VSTNLHTIRTADPIGYIDMTNFAGSTSRTQRSTEMHTMYEALAREHLHELHRDARQRALYRQLAAAKRPAHRPRVGLRRREQRVARVASASAVAE
jgi:hypothetical protein